ncbi:MAG: Crp/Fnr family transcriptional regulator [Alphaproteobacteria bacterium]|nr:Crp/Fnr family transcriptional regulator [Alphaproteobacteria bacterium]
MDTSHPISSILAGRHLEGLAKLGAPRSLAKGEALFYRDDPGDFVFVVESGLIEISVTSRAGRKSVLAHSGNVELVGEISVLDGRPRSADATAVQDSFGRVVSRRDVLAFLAGDSDATIEIIEALCARIRNASDMFETHALTAASARLARCLLQLAEKWGIEDGGRVQVTQSFSQTELGAFAGLARENVNRYIRAWCADGIIGFDRGVIEIIDGDRLTDLAEF